MATALKKKGDKKASKKSDDLQSIVDKTEEVPPEEPPRSSVVDSEVPVEDIPVEKSPSPELIYEEPVLTKLIVKSYDGDINMGLYNGDGDATFVGDHRYKGQFSEGMMHGQGCYTWASGLVYEGQLTHNKVTGKGRYTWSDGSMYEGDVLNGLRHGHGTFRSSNNKLSYTGEWNHGKRTGKGRMDYDEEGLSYYEGSWVQNVRHGWGHRKYPSGNFYQGNWKSNIRHGEGSMRWLDQEQMYTGDWVDGIQHGIGQHVWFLHRKVGSQYPMRNMYDGEFSQGLRNGFGTFYYANGARYEGYWQNNLKSGKGKFIFKNGRVYEGVFDNDHIMDYPCFMLDGSSTPDLSQIRTRTPLPAENLSVHTNDSGNTYGPSFQLDVPSLREFPEEDRDEEATQVVYVIMRHMGELRRIYSFYSQLGYTSSADNTFIMNRMQLWRFFKDCRLHHHHTTLADMDRVLALNRDEPVNEIHSPFSKILVREFIHHIVHLAIHIYEKEYTGTTLKVQWCLGKIICQNILPNACEVHGNIYVETRRAENALIHLEQAYEIFKTLSTPRKQNPAETIFRMRQFLFMLKDMKLINNDLTAKAVIEVLASDNPTIMDEEGSINMELEMTFLEFFEALVGCAQVYVTEAVVKDPTTPCPSTSLTIEQSVLSMTGMQSRTISQESLKTDTDVVTAGLDDGDGFVDGLSPNQMHSETGSLLPRILSEGTQKTAESAFKAHDHNALTTPDGVVRTSQNTPVGNTGISNMSVSDEILKKPASFLSMRSPLTEIDGELVQSMVSIQGGHSEGSLKDHSVAEELHLEDAEQLDEATRQFNFWTHQVHIFFVRKFFPAFARIFLLMKMVAANYPDESEETATATARASVNEDHDSVQQLEIDEAPVEPAEEQDFAVEV